MWNQSCLNSAPVSGPLMFGAVPSPCCAKITFGTCPMKFTCICPRSRFWGQGSATNIPAKTQQKQQTINTRNHKATKHITIVELDRYELGPMRDLSPASNLIKPAKHPKRVRAPMCFIHRPQGVAYAQWSCDPLRNLQFPYLARLSRQHVIFASRDTRFCAFVDPVDEQLALEAEPFCCISRLRSSWFSSCLCRTGSSNTSTNK